MVTIGIYPWYQIYVEVSCSSEMIGSVMYWLSIAIYCSGDDIKTIPIHSHAMSALLAS